jgi:hypothetical protein
MFKEGTMNEKVLPLKVVFRIALITARKIGLVLGNNAETIKRWSRLSMPILIEQGGKQLWIDRLYVAHGNDNENAVHYVYLTYQHIWEEMHSYAQAALLRHKNIKIPEQISRVFHEALMEMRVKGAHYIVFHQSGDVIYGGEREAGLYI